MIPEKFKERMKPLLGEDYPRFIDALENRPAVRGLRVNPRYGGREKLTELPLSPLPYYEGGYILRSEERVGASPAHHAGLYYMQDPGAMAAVAAIEIRGDERIIDLCAAPGGKSTQAAEALSEGFLLSNEYVKKRAWITVGNMERLGVKNAVVTSTDTATLAELYPGYFDIVICDAPCSGEGMFRKGDVAEEEWSPENVAMSAARQREILASAVKLLAPGGRLLYSTCTYSTEENEENVLWLLDKSPDLSLIPVTEKVRLATADGIAIGGREELKLTRRFYPHISEGEGQFIAVLRREDGGRVEKCAFRESYGAPSRAECEIIREFFRENLRKSPEGLIVKCGGGFALISHGCPLPPHSVLMPGVLIGELRGKLLIPSHQLFSAYGELFIRREELDTGDGRVEKYLAGEEISAVSSEGRGWVVLTFRGAPLGGGKLSGGIIKNHYPKGLRNR